MNNAITILATNSELSIIAARIAAGQLDGPDGAHAWLEMAFEAGDLDHNGFREIEALLESM